jgi:CheY-like chemotaxis protein
MPSKPGPIILVDDDPVEHQIIKDVLEALRYNDELICFENGADVLPFLKTTRRQPFLILSDIRMPRLNGLELREAINGDEELRQKSIPFMFLSTTANPHEVRKAYDLTVQGFFEKSPTVPAMQQQLKLVIDYWSRCKHPNSIGQGAIKVYKDEAPLPSRSPS